MNSSLDTRPALDPPLGVQPNFVDPPSIQPAIIGALTACLVISTFSAVLRCYAQWSLFRKFIWVDFWTLLGWVFHVAFSAFLYACIPYGAGRHQWDVTQANYRRIRLLLFVDFVLYDIAILGPKIAILLQLKDIFVPHGRGIGKTARWFFWATVFLISTNFIFYIALSFALIFQCDPVAKGWNSDLDGECLDQNSLLASSGPFNIISDFLIFLLPLSVIWQLQLPFKSRLGAASAFAIGLFGCICSAVRFYYSNRLNDSGDSTYLIFQNQLWANAEVTTGLLIANIIILPRFIRFERVRGTGYGHSYGPSSSRDYATPRRVDSQYGFKDSRLAPARDPYIELDDVKSEGRSGEGFEGGGEKRGVGAAGADANRDIERTIQIDVSREEGPVVSSHASSDSGGFGTAGDGLGNRTQVYGGDGL